MGQTALAKDMRELWKRVRLDTIRSTVNLVIGQLEATDPEARLRDGSACAGPVRVALQVCCDELRAGCGMATVHAQGALAPDLALRDVDWGERHTAALESYRDQARRALREALGPTPTA